MTPVGMVELLVIARQVVMPVEIVEPLVIAGPLVMTLVMVESTSSPV